MYEVLIVAPAPAQDVLDALQARTPDVAAAVERGLDPQGNARVRLTLSHVDSVRLALARETWLSTLRAAGYKAFVV